MENVHGETYSWEERFHTLFQANVAGAILSTPQGQIVDCNEAFARIFGFDSRSEVLKATAWDFYFDKAERDAFISPLWVVENYLGEEAVFRHRSGAPLRVMNSRVVASRVDGRPALVLATSIDVTEQKNLEKRVRDFTKSILAVPEQTPSSERLEFTPFSTEPKLATVFEELSALLRRINGSLRPDKLALIGKPEAQEFVLVVERMKVLVEQLEISRLTVERTREP